MQNNTVSSPVQNNRRTHLGHRPASRGSWSNRVAGQIVAGQIGPLALRTPSALLTTPSRVPLRGEEATQQEATTSEG